MSKRKERDIIAIIGRTNAGKSSLLNLLSGQKDYAIVDKTPGTTADTVITLMEIHDMGPFKFLDTAGVDEYSELGDKKRKKTYEALEEADLSLIVIDSSKIDDIDLEIELIERIKKYQNQALIILNSFEHTEITEEKLIKVKEKINLPILEIKANDKNYHQKLINFIKKHYDKETRDIDLLPNIKEKGFALLVIPMDEETPTLRLLRPQDMAVERLLRKFSIPVLFRLNLTKARSSNKKEAQEEFTRYTSLINLLKNNSEKLQIVITDSQAFDIVPKWTSDDVTLTSFSIMMAHHMSKGNLDLMLDGVKAVDNLKAGSRVLILESCNHNRKCGDIGTVQIPRILEKKIGVKLDFEFNFGRPFSEKNLTEYDLIIHCGACMIDRQKYARRLLKAKEAKTPITNYGILLSYVQNEAVLKKVTKPFI
jgi:[FeFe] hydrogenase H-cluster maturation GTPase HydF